MARDESFRRLDDAVPAQKIRLEDVNRRRDSKPQLGAVGDGQDFEHKARPS